jgi:hypothetical protein
VPLVRQTDLQEQGDMRVVQAVIHELAGPPRLNQAQRAEDPQVLGDT